MRPSSVLSFDQVANTGAVFHPNKRTLITGYSGSQSRLDLWELATQQLLQSVTLQSDKSRAPNAEKMLQRDDVQTKRLSSSSLAISPDGSTCAVACENFIKLVDLGDGRSMRECGELEAEQRDIRAVEFSHDGELIISASSDGKIVIWRTRDHKVSVQFQLLDTNFRCAAFSCDDLLVSAGDSEGNVCVWDVVTTHQLAHFQAHDAEVGALSFSPKGYLLATGGFDGAIKLWNMALAEPFGNTMSHGDSIKGLAFSRDGTLLYSCSVDKRVGLWRLDSQKPIDVYEGNDSVLAMAVSHDSSLLALVTGSALELVESGHPRSGLTAPGARMMGVSSQHSIPTLSLSPEPMTPKTAQNDLASPKDVSSSGGLIIGELDDAYLNARLNPQAPAPKPPSKDQNSTFSNVAAPKAPPAPPEAPLGLKISSPFTTGSLEVQTRPSAQRVPTQEHFVSSPRVLSDDSGDPPAKTSKKNKATLIAASLIAAIIAAALASMTVPSEGDTSGFAEEVTPIEADFDTKLSGLTKSYNSRTAKFRRQLEKVEDSPGNTNKKPMIDRLEASIEAETKRYESKVSALESTRDKKLDDLKVKHAESGIWRALGAGAVTFAVIFALLSAV